MGNDLDPDDFISHYLTELGFEGNCKEFLYISAKYIAQNPENPENPEEPGLTFEDGSYSENGGAKTLEKGSQSGGFYIRGPNNMYRELI